MTMRTYEELLASQTELAHFNPNHDPRNGQFAKGHGGISAGAKKKSPSQDQNTTSKKKKEIRDLAIGGAAIVGTALATYGAVKLIRKHDPTQRKLREIELFDKTLDKAYEQSKKNADVIDAIASKYGSIEELLITPSRIIAVVKDK